MRTAILHVGFAKTASTSIQHTLADNMPLLEKHGFRFSFMLASGQWMSNHSLVFANAFSPRAHEHHVNVLRGVDVAGERDVARAEIERMLDGPLTPVFSAEELPFSGAENMGRVAAFLAERGFRPRVIALVRPPVSYFGSMAQQFVKSGFDMAVPYPRSPAVLGRACEAAFGTVEFHAFPRAVAHPLGPVGYFLDLLDPALAPRAEIARNNEAISDQAARLCAHVNRCLPMIVDGRANPLRRTGDIARLLTIPGDRFHLRRSELQLPRVREEAAWMEAACGPGFAEDLDALDNEPTFWSEEQVRLVADALPELSPTMRGVVLAYMTFAARFRDGTRRDLLAILRSLQADGTLL